MGQQRLSKQDRKQIIKLRRVVKATGDRESEKYLNAVRGNFVVTGKTIKTEREYA